MTEADIISCVEFNQDGDLLATGDKGGRVVIFQRDAAVSRDCLECGHCLFHTSVCSLPPHSQRRLIRDEASTTCTAPSRAMSRSSTI